MDEPLHPSSLSEILDRTAQIYRSQFLVFLGVALLPGAALLVLAGVGALFLVPWSSSRIGIAPPGPAGFVAFAIAGGVLLVGVAIWLGTNALATAAINHAAARAFRGETATIRGSYGEAWGRGWGFLALSVIQLTSIWVLPIGIWSGLLAFSSRLATASGNAIAGGGVIFLLGFLTFAGLAAYGLWMALRLSLGFAAAVVERNGAWAALKRSAVLTRGTKGRIFLLYLLGAALNWLLSISITVPIVVVIALLPGAASPQHTRAAGTILVIGAYSAAFLVQALTRPVYGIALMLFYYDQRIRLEGFDIEWMMQRAGLVAPTDQVPPAGTVESAGAEPSAGAMHGTGEVGSGLDRPSDHGPVD